MNGTVFLYIATIFNHDLPPIATNSRTWTNVNIFTDYHLPGNRSLRMYKTAGMYNWPDAVERIDHVYGFGGQYYDKCSNYRETAGGLAGSFFLG